MPASGGILEAAVFDLCGEVGMTGAGTVLQVFVVPGSGVVVANDGGNGRAAGKAVQNTGQELRPVPLLPGGGPAVLAGSPAVEKDLKCFQIHRQTGRNPVQGHADGSPVGLTENGELQVFTVGTAHSFLLTDGIPSRSWGRTSLHIPPPE